MHYGKRFGYFGINSMTSHGTCTGSGPLSGHATSACLLFHFHRWREPYPPNAFIWPRDVTRGAPRCCRYALRKAAYAGSLSRVGRWHVCRLDGHEGVCRPGVATRHIRTASAVLPNFSWRVPAHCGHDDLVITAALMTALDDRDPPARNCGGIGVMMARTPGLDQSGTPSHARG